MADVPAQLYQLQKSTASPDKIVLQNLPTPLSKRISEKALNWQDLSGYLQRALLWDTGLILTDEGKLIQVHVPCGKTMAQIFLPKEVFDPATCSLEACNLKNLHFASTNCSVDDVFKVSQCAVEDDVQILSKSSVWAEDGDIDSVPDVRLYRFEPDADAITTNRSRASVLFTINQERKVLKTTENCPAKAFFIVPCKQKADTNAGDWCPPSKGGFVDLWLEAERQKTKSAPTSSISAATIFLVLFLVTLVGSMTALIVHTVKKRRQAKSLTSTSLYNTADAESGSVHNSAPRAQPTMMVPSNFTIASNCTSMDIETLNESIRRRSIELRLSLNATLGLVMCVTWLASGVPQAMAEGDLVHRLYQLDRTGKFADRIELSASDVPSEVTKRLDKVGLKWPLLSGLLQRAVLWDHGLVFVGPKKLVQVYTGCSKTMSDLVFSMSLVSSITKNESKCTIDRCGTHNHFLMPGCPTDVIAPYTRCAIKPSPDAAYSAGVYWAEDDQSFEVPNTIVRVHSRPNSSRDTLYAIHLTTDDFIDQSSCKPTNNFIVPCQEKKETDIDFCVPALGSTVDAWLRIVAMPPESSFSTTSVVLLGTLVLICVGLSIVLWRMHRTRLHGKVQRLSNLNDSLLGTHRNLMSADDQTNIHNSMPVDYFHSAMNHHSSNGSDDTASNNELLIKSESLRRFVSDPVIVTKRMAFSQINFLRMLTKAIKALVHSCVNLDPARRPSAMQVVYTLRSKILPELRKELELQES
ncbi:TPA: hypothetical protein N0F65_001472, partial [Lagenidium giganteum]